MEARHVQVRSQSGQEFDCYLAQPEGAVPTPSIVLASAIHGLNADMRELADEFASYGFIAVVPDLFWRSIPGPLPSGDPRAAERAQPRRQKIAAGEPDLLDTLVFLRTLPNFSGRAAVMGFCYGGPYALIAPKRLGYSAGISCHGTRMQDYLEEVEGLSEPVCLLWGDQDDQAPSEVLKAFEEVAHRAANIQMKIFPGVKHGYMMRENKEGFDLPARDVSVHLARAVMESLRTSE